ncbi:DEAD/DEAH box helicase [Cerasicoccus maritimus]|uniref:DEAD/DEAH box helicase n=1 Tax=Cerasicoccus maritimus TaxID=490089 RepID=UPI00285282BA|nr:DEAD/DEAH box helicase [Cerasicoccus maritimus]
MSGNYNKFSDQDWLSGNGFTALAEISKLLDSTRSIDENQGREFLIRTLEHRHIFNGYQNVLDSLIQKAGLYPYLLEDARMTTGELVNYEYHTADGLEGIYLHSAQARVYRALLDGISVILSAPTSFGKSLLIDAMIASKMFNCIVVIVPTIALIDETRRRLTKRFSGEYKVITHATQDRTGKDIFILTQERFVEFQNNINPQFFVLDEFYKLSPERGDERTFVLNQAFYKLFKSGAQFFLIGPNVQDITVDETDLNFRFYRFNFSTVATEIRYAGDGTQEENALEICEKIEEPTLIFCRSAKGAYKLAEYLIENGVSFADPSASEMAEWLRRNYHPEWILPKLLDAGFAVHHGSLPRSIAYHLLRKFNQGNIRFLLCTSTIIEGVNTSAKNIIIYENKIASKKFDQFTFNNIKGRAGRMFQHFVGHVYVLHPEPDPELPSIDIPSITQPEDAPESLLIHIDHGDLSERSLEQLRYLHAQDYLPMEVIRQSNGVDPRRQVDLAAEIMNNAQQYHEFLSWRGHPRYEQLQVVCRLIFDHLMGGSGKDGIVSASQLCFHISRLSKLKSIQKILAEEIKNPKSGTPSEAIESVLKILRQWGEFHFPRYLAALDRIQASVFGAVGLNPGDYSAYGAAVKHLFMHPAVTTLEEYGLPYKLTDLIVGKYDLGEEVDSFIYALRGIDPDILNFTDFEKEMFFEVLDNI